MPNGRIEADEGQETRPVKVLLVEDNRADARLIEIALGRVPNGCFAVTWVQRVAAALASLSGEEFDVALLDLGLPDSDGFSAITEIQPACPYLPIVVLTGASDEARGTEAIRRGAQDYLIKNDCDGKAVARAIRYAIERKQAEMALRRAHDELEQRVRERTSELLTANEALRTSEARLSEAQRIARLGGWDWNVATRELTGSAEFFRIFGLPPQSPAVPYATLLACVSPDDRPQVSAQIERALRGASMLDLAFRLQRPDNQERWVKAQGELTRNDRGDALRLVGTVLDITEQVRAQEEAALRQQQLVQADKMVSLGILVSGIAHEVNNPNHSIMSNASILQAIWRDVAPILERFHEDFGDFVLGGYDYSAWKSRIGEMYDSIVQNSRRIENIVRELRDYAGQNPADRMAPVSLNAVVESAHVLLTNMIKKSTSRFEQQRASGLPAVRGNFQRLEQVVINLIQNACQALVDISGGICVTTRAGADAKTVVLEVRDEGGGIAAEDLPRVTDPFFTTKRGIGGMGLGLWICSNIVHEHGGTFQIESEPGRGTTVSVVLPAMEPGETA